jgi:hypothetical protein
MGREEALHYIATNIGHSRKMGLDPSERAKRVVAGKYGVGLLGFWSIGRVMSLRSRVAGSGAYELEMEEDTPRGKIRAIPPRTDAAPTFTEIQIAPVHEVALKALSGRRLSEYLASELRGQILAHKARVVVRDRIARGTAQKEFPVAPKRFSGERLELPEQIDVSGHSPIRLELYLARGADRPAIQVACAGTVVADDIAELHALGLNERPWIGAELTGLLDFASFNVPPGTRRGVAPDRAAAAFARALEDCVQPLLLAELERLEAQRRAAIDRDVVRELSRALRGLRRKLPQYDLPAVPGSERGVERRDESNGRALTPPPGDDANATGPQTDETLDLFQPGAIASLQIVPGEIVVAPGSERRVHAVARDANSQRIRDASFVWRINGSDALSVRGDGPRPAIVAAPGTALGTNASLEVTASDPRHAAVCLAAKATILVGDVEPTGAALGVPEPRRVSDPDGRWRSRMLGDRWEINEAHPDYVSLRSDSRARVRYLLALLAKEIVVRTTGRADAAEPLESLVEILAHAEHNLRGS